MKRYTVIGQLNGRWYDLLMNPLDDEYEASCHANAQNMIVPDLNCRVVEYKAGKYEYWPDLDNESVSSRRSSLEDILSGVNFDGQTPDSVIEYKDGFNTKPVKRESKPSKKSNPEYDIPLNRPQKSRKRSFIDSGYGQLPEGASVDWDAIREKNTKRGHEIAKAEAQAGWVNPRVDPFCCPTPGYIPPTIKRKGCGLLALIIPALFILSQVIA